MKRKYIVELDDNEVLMKYTIDEKCMDDFIGRTTQLMDYVCNTPPCPDDEKDKWAEIELEDSVYTTLNDGTVSAVYEVLASPIRVQDYVDGKYSEKVGMYIGKQVKKIVDEFFPPSLRETEEYA